MSQCNPAATPMEHSLKLLKDNKEEDPADDTVYQATVGSLLYL